MRGVGDGSTSCPDSVCADSRPGGAAGRGGPCQGSIGPLGWIRPSGEAGLRPGGTGCWWQCQAALPQNASAASEGCSIPGGSVPPSPSWVFQAWWLLVPPVSWHFTPRCSAFPACRWSIIHPAHQPSRTAPIWPWRQVQAHPRAGQDAAEGSGSGCCPHPLLGVGGAAVWARAGGGSLNAWLAPDVSGLMTLALYIISFGYKQMGRAV